MKIQMKVLLPVAVLCLMLTASISMLFIWRYGAEVEREFDNHGFSLLSNLSTNGRIGLLMGDPGQLSKTLEMVEALPQFRYASFHDASGTVLFEKGSLSAEGKAAGASRKVRDSYASETPDGEPLQVYRQPVHSRGTEGAPIGYVSVAMSKAEMLSNARQSLLWSGGIAALFLVLAVLTMRYIIDRTVIAPITTVVTAISNADLNSRFDAAERDEVGDLQRALDRFIASIRETLLGVGEAAGKVVTATAEIRSSTEQMAAGSQEQSSQTTEIAAAVEEMSRTLEDGSRNIADAAETAQKAGVEAQRGGTVVTDTIAGMRRIADVVTQSAEQVRILGTSSDRIGEIISVIDDIADQTNLLALNAAIEAARAGDQGRGFAVVADEVRKLAERTTKATKEIAEMIRKIQTDTTQAVASMQRGTEEVGSGIALAEQAGTMLSNIVGNADAVSSMMQQIATASREQTVTANQVSKNIESISAVTRESVTGIHQIVRTAEDLNQLTAGLQRLLERFRLGNGATAAGPAREFVNGRGAEAAYRTSSNGHLVER
ncbi:MAG: methyl-accepting chemotaxis protein [Bacteroidetes bacterium]|nr:MAG: methyl-accepting chemotaxis protein [Bacteroidota bacterium]